MIILGKAIVLGKLVYPMVAAGAVAVTEASELGIGNVPVVGITAPVLVSLFVIALYRGDIVSGKVHRERVEDYKEEVVYWRQAHGVSEEGRKTALEQVDKLNNGLRDVALSIKGALREGE